MRCERVPERAATHCLRYTRLEHRTVHMPLQHSLVQMTSSTLARSLVRVNSRRRKDPLPGPLAASVRVLPGECIRQRYCSCAICQIALVLIFTLSKCALIATSCRLFPSPRELNYWRPNAAGTTWPAHLLPDPAA